MRKFLAATIFAATAALAPQVQAQQTQSHLFDITKQHLLRVCTFPLYYSISFRNPKTGELEGIDADMARELAKELGAKLQFVETSFGTFIADLQANKCDIGMFAVGATLQRAQAVEFSKPYLMSSVYAIVRKGSKVKSWDDIDKPGVTVAVSLGSYIETFMKGYLKNAKVVSIAPPATREAELMANHVDVEMTDFPTAIKLTDEFDWAVQINPPTKLSLTPYSYVIAPGDQIWLNYINLFIDTVKLDGRLAAAAHKYRLDPIVAQ